MYSKKQTNSLGFIYPLMITIISIGILMLIYLIGFLELSPETIYRIQAKQTYYPAQISIVPQRTQDNINAGKSAFASNCVACHGKVGDYQEGLLGPDLIDEQWLHFNNETQIYSLIIQGIGADISKSGNVMPARGGIPIQDEAIWHIIYYLSSINPTIQQDSKPTE